VDCRQRVITRLTPTNPRQINKGEIMNNELLKIAQAVLRLETLETQNSEAIALIFKSTQFG